MPSAEVDALIRETWVWTIRAEQPEPTKPSRVFRPARLGRRAARASRRQEVRQRWCLAGAVRCRGLRQKMDQYDLWRGADHVSLKQVLIDFATSTCRACAIVSC